MEIADVPARQVTTAHLPISFAANKGTDSTEHIVEILLDEVDDFDRDALTSFFKQKSFSNLPG